MFFLVYFICLNVAIQKNQSYNFYKNLTNNSVHESTIFHKTTEMNARKYIYIVRINVQGY